MSEQSDSTPIETATSADDPAVAHAPEVGESGPAGPAEQLQGADDSILQEAGNIAGKAETDGTALLQETGDIAAKAETDGTALLQETGDIVRELGTVSDDALGSVGDISRELETDADRMLSDGDWNPGAPPEVGESGPASPVEQPGESSDSISLTVIDIIDTVPAEPGELGPAPVDHLVSDMERAMAQVDAAMADGQLSGLDQIPLSGTTDASSPRGLDGQ